jgi:hypothetical protein
MTGEWCIVKDLKGNYPDLIEVLLIYFEWLNSATQFVTHETWFPRQGSNRPPLAYKSYEYTTFC